MLQPKRAFRNVNLIRPQAQDKAKCLSMVYQVLHYTALPAAIASFLHTIPLLSLQPLPFPPAKSALLSFISRPCYLQFLLPDTCFISNLYLLNPFHSPGHFPVKFLYSSSWYCPSFPVSPSLTPYIEVWGSSFSYVLPTIQCFTLLGHWHWNCLLALTIGLSYSFLYSQGLAYSRRSISVC